MQPVQCAAGITSWLVEGRGGWAGRGWGWQSAVWSFSGVWQRQRRRSATAAHRALPVCVWPALGMPLATGRSNAASAVLSRIGGACTRCCGRPVQVVWEGCGFARFWSCSVMEAVLSNHCAQSPASVCVTSPGHAVGHWKVECSLCSAQQVWWSLHWVLQPSWAGGLGELRFCYFLEFFS